MNTAACRSRITYIDGDKGILDVSRIPDRAARRALSTYLETAYLDPLRRAARPTRSSKSGSTRSPCTPMVHENIKKFMEGFTVRRAPDGRVHQHRRRDARRSIRTRKQIFDERVAARSRSTG